MRKFYYQNWNKVRREYEDRRALGFVRTRMICSFWMKLSLQGANIVSIRNLTVILGKFKSTLQNLRIGYAVKIFLHLSAYCNMSHKSLCSTSNIFLTRSLSNSITAFIFLQLSSGALPHVFVMQGILDVQKTVIACVTAKGVNFRLTRCCP